MINHRLFSISHLQFWITENTHIWLRPVIIVGILLMSAVLPLKASDRILMAVLALPFVAAGGVIITRWPQLFFLAIIAGITIPVDGPSGFNSSMVFVTLLFSLWVLDMMLRKQEIKPLPSITTLPLLMLVVVAILSFGVGLLPWYTFAQSAPLGAQLGGLSIYLLSAVAFLLVGQLGDIRWLKWMIWFFLAIGSVYVAGWIIGPVGSITAKFFPLSGTGSLFWTWLVALAFSQAIFNRDLHLGWRAILLAIAGMTLFVAFVLNEGWKSGWVPPLITIAAIIGLRFWRLALSLSPFAIIPASYLITKTIATDQYSWGTRVDAWLIVAEITKINPVLGLGFANYNWYTVLFPIRGYAVRFNSHSQYIDIIAQTGILGLICFLWFFGVVGWLGWKLLNRVPPGFPQAYVYGALGGLVGTLVAAALGDWVLPFFYNVGLTGFRASVLGWLFLGGLVIFEQLYPLRPEEKEDSLPASRQRMGRNRVAGEKIIL